MSEFVHLHLHTQYSLLDGAVSLKRLFKALPEKNMSAVAITDHGVLYAAIPFYQQAKQAGIHPIIGCEVYLTPGSYKDKSRKEENLYHLVLLAENLEGYRNLMELVSIANTEGFYYKPRIDKDILYRYRRGLIALTACLSGELPTLVIKGQEEKADQALEEYLQIFGRDNFFLELQEHDLKDQVQVNKFLRERARTKDLGLVVSNDVHYLSRDDAEAHDVLLCIQTGKTLDEKERMRFPNSNFYLRSPEEMAELFPDEKNALANTVKIAQRCNVELSFDKFFLPEYPGSSEKTPEMELEEKCLDGLKRLQMDTPEIRKRMDYELEIIKKMGFASYFLIVNDFIEFARREEIAVGPGRGSVAGSLVAYLLGITGIDPLKYGLIFERFLNPERVTMPDIDIDFCFERREEVVEYVTEKYGQDRVAQIITFGTMAARGVIRDVGRVLGFPYGDVDRVAKEIPTAPGIHLKEAIEYSPTLKKRYEEEPAIRRLLDLALKVEGSPRHPSVHAAGVVIAPDRITKFTPLQKNKEDITTQYDMGSIEDIGLLKVDFLGLRTLTVIDHATRMIKEQLKVELDLEGVGLDDKKTYELLQTGRTLGVFQMESALYQRLTRDYQPDSFEDIIAIIALGRPGPMGSDRFQDFIQSRHGRQEINYPHPLLKEILKETYGVILYQEQVMQIASHLGDLTMGEADNLRRGMGKKKEDLIQQYKEKFIENSMTKGLSREKAEEIFELMEYFGGYGFNKSHSAAYALLSYRTAYLKANYPLQFMVALLNSVKDNTDKVALYLQECREMDIEVLPPDINESGYDFTPAGPSLRFGLGAIKNVGQSAIETIVEARKEGEFTSLYDFCRRTDLGRVNHRVLESLIKAGAFASLGFKRSQLMGIMEQTFQRALSQRKARDQGQKSLFGGMEEKIFSGDIEVPAIEEFSSQELLRMERETLGFYISGHPLDPYQKLLAREGVTPLEHLGEKTDQSGVRIGGLISRITPHQTKRGQQMAFILLEDRVAQVEIIVFPDIFSNNRELIEVGQAVLIEGKIDQQEEEGPKILAEEIKKLEVPFRVEMDLEKIAPGFWKELKEILFSYSGSCPIYLELKRGNEKITIALGNAFRAPADEGERNKLKADIKNLLGRNKGKEAGKNERKNN